MPKKITQSELGRLTGLSHTAAAKLVKMGCPLTSRKAATAWMNGRELKRPPTTGKFADQKEPTDPKPLTESKPSRTGDSLYDALQNAIMVADDAFEAYQEARVQRLSSRSVRLSEHSKALITRMKVEQVYREELERRNLLIPKSEAVEMCRRVMEPVLRRLKKLPQERGPQCNPQNALQAVTILQREVNAIIDTGRKALESV